MELNTKCTIFPKAYTTSGPKLFPHRACSLKYAHSPPTTKAPLQ
ncbi:hypothetical protein WDL1P4_00012 (plasmid) [Variovorax sp. WDL1]|nr:hypothetical protein WDL1P4_00012 [Variovorax sp. WDL1]